MYGPCDNNSVLHCCPCGKKKDQARRGIGNSILPMVFMTASPSGTSGSELLLAWDMGRESRSTKVLSPQVFGGPVTEH